MNALTEKWIINIGFKMLLILMACANLKKTDLLLKDLVGCCREAIDSCTCSDDNIAKPHVYV